MKICARVVRHHLWSVWQLLPLLDVVWCYLVVTSVLPGVSFDRYSRYNFDRYSRYNFDRYSRYSFDRYSRYSFDRYSKYNFDQMKNIAQNSSLTLLSGTQYQMYNLIDPSRYAGRNRSFDPIRPSQTQHCEFSVIYGKLKTRYLVTLTNKT